MDLLGSIPCTCSFAAPMLYTCTLTSVAALLRQALDFNLGVLQIAVLGATGCRLHAA